MLTEQLTICMVCGDDRSVSAGQKDGIELVHCLTCSTMRVASLDPQDYTAKYMTGWYQTEHMDTSVQETNAKRFAHDLHVAAQRLAVIEQFKLKGTLLDVGCSNGAFVDWALQCGYDAWGIDLCEDGFAECPAKEAGRLKVSGLSDTGFQRRQVDIITMLDVFEHLLDPKLALKQANGLLKRDGLLVIDLPDFGTPLEEAGLDYHHVKPIEHIFYPSPETVRQMLLAADFTILHIAFPIPGKVVFYAQPNPETVLDVKVYGPTGLGDMHWVLLKLGALKQAEAPCKLHLIIPGYGQRSMVFRAAGFLKLLPMLDSYEMEIADPVIIDEGAKDVTVPHYRILTNGHIERGHRIEDWYPHLATDFHYEVNIPENDMAWAAKIQEQAGRKMIIIYASSEQWNYQIQAGKGWTAKEWTKLVIELNKLGIYPCLIGKGWDRDFAMQLKAGTLIDLIGKTSEGQMLALFKTCAAVVGLCAGSTILSTHIGAKSMVFWPERGKGIGANMEFHKDFQTDWVDPAAIESRQYVPMSLGTFDLDDVMKQLQEWEAL